LAGADLPSTVAPVAVALIIGGVLILLAERWASRTSPVDVVTWPVVIAVGMAQVVAGIFPGTSRSGAAIFAAMLAGLTLRTRAVEFAFLVGIPTMFAAASYELLRTMVSEEAVAAESWNELLVAFIAASVTGFVVVKWLLRFLLSHTFVPFAWYRIGLGFVLLVRIN
jgi:undecaprenyl-diphosphatase